jgi:16S rRNA (adenine1518-N6/adenine1519-N6)-dimethyltransferase
MPFLSKQSLLHQLDALGIRLDKNRGMCYLIDRNIVNMIIDQAALNPQHDIILEIGAGLGTLSDFLVAGSKRAYLVENDNKVAQYLFAHFQGQYPTQLLTNPTQAQLDSIDSSIRVIVIHADALKIPFPQFTKLVANFPYQISAPLLFKMVESWSDITQKAVIMVQKEFAERLVATPNSKNYSRLSAATGLYLHIRTIKHVSNQVFFPPPRVNSTVIELTGKPALGPEANEQQHRGDYLAFLRGLFPYKNKSLRKALKIYFKNSPHAISYLKALHHIFLSYDQFPFFQRKLRQFSPPELFSILSYGISGNEDYLTNL